MKFNKDVLQELAWEYVGEKVDLGDDGIYRVMINDQIDTTRWSVIFNMVFKHNNKYYETSYSRGATEQQDESPYEHDEDEIECPEVEPYKVELTKYRKVNE